MKRFLAYKPSIEHYLTTFLGDREGTIYEPVEYIISLGGKRLRPALLIGTAEALGKEPDSVIHLAGAIELFHNFTLLHDDIMDEASLRRGKETVHLKWNRDQAILSGDVMFALSYELLLHEESKNGREIMSIFTKTAEEVCIGQQLDMDFEKRDEVSAKEYLEMIRLKTSVLLGASAAMGALAAGAHGEVVGAMYSYGMELGLAFQIQDDILDAFSETADMGKVPGGDILQNKKTLLYIYALEMAHEGQRAALKRFYSQQGGSDEKVNGVRAIFKDTGSLDRVKELQVKYLQKAESSLREVSLPEEWNQEFLSMLEFQTERIK